MSQTTDSFPSRVIGIASCDAVDDELPEFNTRSIVARNAAYNLIGQMLLLGLGLVSARYVLRGLGHDAFGLILFGASLTAVMSGALELGIIATTVRVVATHARNKRYLASYVGTSSCLYWSTYAVLATLGYVLAPLIVSKWVRLTDIPPPVAVDGLRLLLIGTLTVLPRNLYASIFKGFQRTEFNNTIEIATSTVQQIGTVVILLRGGGLLTVASWMLFVCVLALGAYVVTLSRLLSPIALLPRFSRRVIRDHWKFAANSSGNSLLTMLFMQSDKLVVSTMLPLSAFGYYSFAWTSTWRIASLTTVVSQAAFPSLVSLSQSGATPHLTREYRRFHDLVCYGAAVPVTATAFASLPLLSYLFSARVAETLIGPIALLSIASFMYATLTMPMALAAATGRPDFMTRVNVLALFSFLPLMVVLVALWGLVGAGLAWLAYYGLVYAYLIPRVSQYCLQASAGRWYRDIAPVYLKLFGTYGLAWTFCFVLARDNVLAWGLGFACSTTAFLILAAPVLNELRGSSAVGSETPSRSPRTTEA